MEKYKMATQSVSGTGTRNNGATIKNAGNVASRDSIMDAAGTAANNDSPLGIRRWGIASNKPVQQTGTKAAIATVTADDVPTGKKQRPGRAGIITAKGSGTFAYDNQPGKVVGKRLSTTLNGVANSSLQSGGVGKGARTNSAIGGCEVYYTLPQYLFNADGSVETVTAFDGSSTNYVDPAVAGGATASNDSAANPTRAIPGELVYTDSSQSRNTNNSGLGVPKQDDYKGVRPNERLTA